MAHASLYRQQPAIYNGCMNTQVDVEGLDAAIEQVAAIQEGLSGELQDGLQGAMQPIRDAVSSYPPVPPYVGSGGMAHHTPRPYTRTGYYGSSITPVQVDGDGAEVSGYFATPAPYAIYLRGTPDGSYSGAWMHTPYWQSLNSIITSLLPDAIDILQGRVDDFISRIMGD